MANNNAIRFLRTKANAEVTQSNLYDLDPGQPLFDQKNNLLYIGTSYYDAKSLVPCYRHVITVCWQANRGELLYK